jgi:hypothetical protein
VTWRAWPPVIVVSSLALLLAAALPVHGLVRGLLALWFFLTCPGMAIIGLLELGDPLGSALLGVALSVALGVLVSLVMVLTRSWSPDAGMAVLVTVSLAGAAAQAWRARRR